MESLRVAAILPRHSLLCNRGVIVSWGLKPYGVVNLETINEIPMTIIAGIAVHRISGTLPKLAVRLSRHPDDDDI